jgi:peptidoglycan/LPS O-acetylase OafA/YrhL
VAIALRQNKEKLMVALSRMLLPLSAASIVLLGVANHGLNFGNPAVQLMGYPLLGLFACSLIVRSLEPASWTARAMTNPVLRFYGRYSYGLYVYNYLLHNSLKEYLYPTMSSHIANALLLNVGYMLTCFALLTGISVLSFHLYENPFLRLKRKFESSSAKRRAPAGSQVATANQAA